MSKSNEAITFFFYSLSEFLMLQFSNDKFRFLFEWSQCLWFFFLNQKQPICVCRHSFVASVEQSTHFTVIPLGLRNHQPSLMTLTTHQSTLFSLFHSITVLQPSVRRLITINYLKCLQGYGK